MEANECDFAYISGPTQHDYSEKCLELFGRFQTIITGLNFYDINRPCWTVNDTSSLLGDAIGEVQIGGETKTYRKYYGFEDYTPWLFKPNLGGRKKLRGGSCTWNSPMAKLFNDPAVRTALHIDNQAPAWEDCTNSIDYTENEIGSHAIYLKLKGKYRVLHYSGDTDNAVPTYGTQRWIHAQGWKPIKGGDWRPWFVNDQVAGYTTNYDGDFTFTTVHGVGHMVP